MARSADLGVELDDDRLAAEVRELHVAAVVVEEGEVGGFVAGLDHVWTVPGSTLASSRSRNLSLKRPTIRLLRSSGLGSPVG
jgi:hypothetical protein